MFAHPIKNARCKVALFLDAGRFVVKTADSADELKQVFKLRHDVYYRELLQSNMSSELDIDQYDAFCDHLAIICKKTGQTIATYRIICSLFSSVFYSQSEFNLDNLLRQAGVKLELGRSCVHKDYRRGMMIMLLWRAIAEYMKKTRAHLLFGCASVPTTDVQQAALIHVLLNQQHQAPASYRVYPVVPYCFDNLEAHVAQTQSAIMPGTAPSLSMLVPPLFKAYLGLGAVSCGAPAVDQKFQCADFLLALDSQKLDQLTKKKYGV